MLEMLEWGWIEEKLGGYGGTRPLEGPSAGLRVLGIWRVRKAELVSLERL
jgi:hypothetical protein